MSSGGGGVVPHTGLQQRDGRVVLTSQPSDSSLAGAALDFRVERPTATGHDRSPAAPILVEDLGSVASRHCGHAGPPRSSASPARSIRPTTHSFITRTRVI